MSTKDFTANVISATKVVPDGKFKDSKASGIWDINEALDLIKGGNWPNVANVNPAAFVDGLFSTDLYIGNGGAKTITNDINLSNSGGLVWFKPRGETGNHQLIDTARGTTKYLMSNSVSSESTLAQTLDSFNTNGFTIGQYWSENNKNFVTWTFRQQPKFFDIVTYEGTGSARTVAHSLNTTVGMIIIKNRDQNDNWAVYHRANTNAPQTDYLSLNLNNATADSAAWWNDTAPTSSVFTVGTDHAVNADGENYVAYVFAHNNDDGGFGEPGDQDIIKCGTFSTDGNGLSSTTLGFEPQFLLMKVTDGTTGAWHMVDSTRGMPANPSKDGWLMANLNNAESQGNTVASPTATGFVTDSTNVIDPNCDFVFMAIRRGGMQTPTAASDVFSIVQNTNTLEDDTKVDFGIVPDMHIANRTTSGMSHFITARLTGGKYMFTNSNSAEDNTPLSSFNEEQTTVEYTGTAANDSGTYNHIGWKRARGYFDIVTYTGNGTAGRTVNHNLGVAPEMMWIKQRDGAGDFAAPCDYTDTTFRRLQLSSNGGSAAVDYTSITSDGSNPLHNKPTATQIILNSAANVNQNTKTYIAFLFATAPGVSKVGTVTHSGSSTDVDCGFTSGASLVILKRVDDSGSWLLFDSVRGIIAGNSPYLKLQAAAAEVTSVNQLNPLSSGFQIADDANDGDYIFYAIAAIS